MQRGAQQRPFGLAPFEHDEALLARRLEQRRVDSFGDEPVITRKPQRGGSRRLLRRREQDVEPAEQLLALRPPRRVREPLGREERGDCQALGLAQSEVGETRQRRLEAVDDVEAPGAQGTRDIGAHADGDTHAAPARDRDRRPEGEQLPAVHRSIEQREPARGKVGGAIRRRDDRYRVAEDAQLPRDARDVLVHLVRLRPRERCDEADAKRHAPSSLVASTVNAFPSGR